MNSNRISGKSAHRWPRLAQLAAATLAALAFSSCGSDEILTGGQTKADTTQAADQSGLVDGGLEITQDAPPVEDAPTPPDAAPADSENPPDAPVDVAVDTGPACKPDHCLIGEQCLSNGASHPTNPCLRCNVLVDRYQWSASDGGSDGKGTCDDGDSCTVGDHCQAGTCSGAGKVCDDGNPCTDDKCDLAQGCTSTANSLPCSDGNPCTLGDTCTATACGPGPNAKACDDGDLCTDDSCNPKQGCVALPNAATCDDGEVCTIQDHCQNGKCAGGGPADCDDKDVCTIDACTPKVGCAHTSIADLCTDDNPCTDQACDKVKGCVFPFNTQPCDDKNACTASDTCSSGACVGTAVPFDDANLCTDDSCDPAIGPVHVANTLGCDDNNVCTLDDTCGNSACQPGQGKKDCDDANLCTDDSCDPKAGCLSTDNTATCDDGTVCTKDDVCGGGKCAGTAISCDDKNDCTTDSCDPKAGCKHDLIVSNACRPVIDVEYPPRAATIKQPSPIVTVKGTVKSGAGPITSFTINGKDVPVGAGGAFTLDLSAKVGGNSLVFVAQDNFGSQKQRVQAFLWSTDYAKPQKAVAGSGMVDPGMAFWLSQQVIDDGNHSLPPNDLATIFELAIQSMNLASLIKNPLYTANGSNVSLNNLKYDPAKVTLKAKPGGLGMTATINNVSGDLAGNAKSACIGSFCLINLSVNGSKLTMSSIVITTDVLLSVNPDHTLQTKMVNTAVALNNIDVTLSNPVLNFLIGWLVDFMINSFKATLQQQFATQVVAALEPQLSGALGALALNASFDISKLDGSGGKVTLTLQSDFSSVQADTPGIAFLERARVTTDKATPYDNLGVPARIGCGKPPQTMVILKKDPLELVVADDTFNQILYGTWLGGLFEFPVPASMLGNVDLGQYGVSDLTMKVSAMLAPTMDDCGSKGELDAFVGDFRVDATMKLMGQPMDVVVYATFTSGLEIKASDSSLGIALTQMKSSALQVDVKQDNLVGSEAVLQKLIGDTLLNGLVAQLGGNALGSFPIPSVDLSKALPSLPPGTGLAINPKNVTRAQGNTVVGGNLK